MKTSPVVETHNLTKYYGKTLGCKNLNFTVNQGEVFGFLGPNGAGKTTTIRLLLNLLKPTSGSAKIFGLDTREDSVKIREEIGNLPGDINFYKKMKAVDFLNYLERFHHQQHPHYKFQLAKLLELDLNKKIRAYSKGNYQKLGIIQALMHKPKLIILDEPTNSLDPLVQQTFYKIIGDFKKKGHTVFFSSHVLSEVEKIADRVGIIRKGEIVAIKSIPELRQEKIQHLRVLFKEKVAAKILRKIKGVLKVKKENQHFVITYQGHVDPLVKALAKHTVLDLNFRETDLESVFLQYYK